MPDRLRPWILGNPAAPEFVPVGIPIGSREIEAVLSTPDHDLDVTANTIALSLHPLIVGIALDPAQARPLSDGTAATLTYRRPGTRTPLGSLRLEMTERRALPNATLAVFQPRGSRNHCRGRLRVWAYERYALRRQAKGRHPHSRAMTSPDLRALMVHYIQPRPVAFVSVGTDRAFNIFPMDLIAPAPNPAGLILALRRTSPAHALIEGSGHVALSDVPGHAATDAYTIGRHHHTATITPEELPFACGRSPGLDLPVPAYALRVRELIIEDRYAIGSHEVYVARLDREDTRPDTPALHHIHALYAQRRRLDGVDSA